MKINIKNLNKLKEKNINTNNIIELNIDSFML